MKFETFKTIATYMYNSKKLMDDYLDKYPSDYQLLIIDNDYANTMYTQCDFLLKQLLDKFNYECLMWFLHEWKLGFSIKENNIEYILNNFDDYLKYKEQTWIE